MPPDLSSNGRSSDGRSSADVALTGAALTERARLALAVPLSAALDLRLRDESDPAAGLLLRVAGPAANGFGGTHSAALVALLESTAYLALAPQLCTTEHAVTQSLSLHLPAAAPDGASVVATAEVDRRTRRAAYLSVVARLEDGPVVARAQVVKAVVPFG